jgi:hypothetical protein
VKNLKKNISKPKITTINVILTLTIFALIVSVPLVSAPLDLPAEVPTFLYTSVSPNPVGVNQIVYLQAIFTHPLPTSHGMLGDRHENVIIEVTKPDGSVIELGPYTAGMTGGVATSWTPTEVGEYSIRSIYPDQICTLTNPYNDDPNTADYHPELLGSTFLGSESPAVTLTVQQDAVEPIYQTPAIPDYYWTRPVYATNWEWGKQIASNWYGLDSSGFTTCGKYDAIGGFDPYGKAPNAPHILWTKPLREGGQPGGPLDSDQSTNFVSTDITVDQYDGSIIVGGVLYYTKYAGWGAGHNYIDGWEAVDLRTGETLWSKPAGLSGHEFLRYGQVYRWHNDQGFGANGFLWSIDSDSSSIFGPTGDMTFRIYDAYTCKHLANITTQEGEADTSAYARNLACITDIEGDNPGGLLSYYTQGNELLMWNSTKILAYMSNGQMRSSLSYTDYSFSDGVQWRVPTTFELNGQTVNLGLASVTREVILLRSAETFSFQGTQFGYQITAGIDAKTGAVLWGPINQSLPLLVDMNLVCARDGYYFMYDSDNHDAYCYSLTSGQKLWGPIAVPFDAYASQNVWGEIAYGKVFFNGGGAIVNAMDLETGNLEWSYSRGSSGYDTPFGIYPVFGYQTQTVCDGKLFISEGYLYTPPLHPARRLVLNCTDGSLVWSILSYSSRTSGAHADECFVEHNAFDNQLYVYGKGPSQTTVTAPDAGVAQGSSVMIRGTVMDISAGTDQAVVTNRFPNGLPAVSDESMREWMEYVYMQQNCPPDVEGVKVFLKIQDPNGDWYSATVTTDANGRYSHMWAPSIVGEYKVTAMFEGSESYYPSQETITFGVDDAAAVAGVPSAEEIAQTTVNKMPTLTAPEMPAYLTIDLVILIIAAVGVVIGLLAYMALRKQK